MTSCEAKNHPAMWDRPRLDRKSRPPSEHSSPNTPSFMLRAWQKWSLTPPSLALVPKGMFRLCNSDQKSLMARSHHQCTIFNRLRDTILNSKGNHCCHSSNCSLCANEHIHLMASFDDDHRMLRVTKVYSVP